MAWEEREHAGEGCGMGGEGHGMGGNGIHLWQGHTKFHIEVTTIFSTGLYRAVE